MYVKSTFHRAHDQASPPIRFFLNMYPGRPKRLAMMPRLPVHPSIHAIHAALCLTLVLRRKSSFPSTSSADEPLVGLSISHHQYSSVREVSSSLLSAKSQVLVLLRNCSAEDLSAEEVALCALDDLLVDGLRWVVHNHGALLVVDLCVHTSVADKVDDPLLTLILRETEAG